MLPTLHTSFLTSLIDVSFTLLITVILNSLLRSLIRVPKRLDSRRGRTYVSALRSIISIILFAVALHIIFIILGINITPLLASAGIVGIAIGIGARSVIEDFIAGFFLLSHANIAIGDHVFIDNAEGIIEDIGFRVITLRGIDGALRIIPNGQVKQVVNYSRGHAVLPVDIPVKTGQDIDNILGLLKEILNKLKDDKKIPMYISSESKVLGIQNIAQGNSIVLRVLIFTNPGGRETADKEFRYRVIKSFEKNKIAFA